MSLGDESLTMSCESIQLGAQCSLPTVCPHQIAGLSLQTPSVARRLLTVGAEEALELGHQADQVELPQEAFVLHSCVQPHHEATG